MHDRANQTATTSWMDLLLIVFAAAAIGLMWVRTSWEPLEWEALVADKRTELQKSERDVIQVQPEDALERNRRALWVHFENQRLKRILRP